MNPLISILIPNFNKGFYLTETLNSVLAQTYRNWECIVVDDHSTDNSWVILDGFVKRDNRIQIFKRPDSLPKGGNTCRNYAFTLSKGEYIQWFDSDDVMALNMLDARVNSLNRNNSDFVVSNGRRFETDLLDRDIIITPLFAVDDFLKFFILIMTPWLSQSVMYKRSFLENYQIIWNESLSGLQDVAFNFFSVDQSLQN
ncbi:glycosyltransferase family 2 protein [Algoriphagus boritolerans]|uniref:glycosyltransferase family 2 protein n=1 Tax=Algoriphagus boritolerans TaxID=308111 RepID=UPI000ACBC2E8